MFKKRWVASLALCLMLSGHQIEAQAIGVSEIQDLGLQVAVDKKQVLTQDHWLYETLVDFTKKYGGKMNEKKALSREEAAFILVNLVGKVQESNVKMADSDKALLRVMKKELDSEIKVLSGRVAMLEDDVNTLEGRVTKIEDDKAKTLKFNYGDDFRITGSFQANYVGNTNKGEDNYPSNFRIPLSEVYVTGKVNPHLDFTINMLPNILFEDDQALLADAFLQTDIIPYHDLQVGQTPIPFGQEGPMWLVSVETADKAQMARNHMDRLDMGVKIRGHFDPVDYYLGAYNGSGINTDDNNTDLATAGWLNLRPLYNIEKYDLKNFEIGGGYYSGKSNTLDEDSFGAYAGYETGPFKIRSEYAKIKGYQLSGQKADSWYILSQYKLTDKLALVGRYDVWDPNTKTAHDSNTEWTFGTNYEFRENIALKVNFVHVDSDLGKNSQRINVLTQYLF